MLGLMGWKAQAAKLMKIRKKNRTGAVGAV